MSKENTKTNWWGEELNQAFDIFFLNSDPTLTDKQKEEVFTEKLYPAMKRLAAGAVYEKSSGIAYSKMTPEELTDTIITNSLPVLARYDATRDVSRSSYVLMVLKWSIGSIYRSNTVMKNDMNKTVYLDAVETDSEGIVDCVSYGKYNEEHEFEMIKDQEFVRLALDYVKQHQKELLTMGTRRLFKKVYDVLSNKRDSVKLCEGKTVAEMHHIFSLCWKYYNEHNGQMPPTARALF